jgi:hypothetical protein
MAERMLIAAVVPAADIDDAVQTAHRAFDRLVGDGTRRAVFDAYVTFDADVAGLTDRCGEWPAATPVRTERGTTLLERQWAATWTAFLDGLERVCAAVRTRSTAEIMQDVGGVRHAFKTVGATEGPAIYLYDEYGLGIRHRNRLDAVLGQAGTVWIVPAEVRH